MRHNILVLTSSFNILKEVTSRPLIIEKSHSSEGTTKCTEVRCEPCSLIFSGESSAKSGRECFNRSAETFSRFVSREWWSAKIARMIGAASVRISPVLAISRSLCIALGGATLVFTIHTVKLSQGSARTRSPGFSSDPVSQTIIANQHLSISC